MASYKLLFKKSVARDLRKLPVKDVVSILKRIDALADYPRARGCKKLSGGDYYRVRTGNYRIVYEIKEPDIFVLGVIHRRPDLQAEEVHR